MSAADLFKDPYDVEFRLKGTYIMIGRDPYFVRQVYADGPKVENTGLHLFDMKDEDRTIRIGKLPLQTMTACPHGYFEGAFWARGPARHRWQGINGSSFWCVHSDGLIDPCGHGNCKKLLRELSIQPRTRRVGKRPQGILTRDVMIDNKSRVLVRGRHRANYIDNNRIEPVTEISPITQQLLDNAKLSIKEPKSFMEIPMPTEIIQ